MVKTIGGDFQLGIWGLTQNQISNNINTNGEWQTIDFVFKTAASLQPNQYMWWNNSGRTGLYGYIDNWEMYDVSDIVSGLSLEKDKNIKIFSYNGQIVTEINSEIKENVEISVYNLQGACLHKQNALYNIGINRFTVEKQLPSGVYLIKITAGNGIFTSLIVK